MKTIAISISWINSKIVDNWILLLISITGIPSGILCIWYVNYSSSKSFNQYWWTIPLSSIIWVALRIFLRHPRLLYVSILYYLGNVIYGLYKRDSPSELSDIFFLTSFLLMTMNVTEYFLFSLYTTKIVVITAFALLIAYEILPAVLPRFNMSYTHIFVMFLLLVLVTSSIMVIFSELFIFFFQEFFGKVHKKE